MGVPPRGLPTLLLRLAALHSLVPDTPVQAIIYPPPNPFSAMLIGLLHTHSGLRYLVLLAAVIALAYALVGWLGKRRYDRGMRITGMAFAGLLHLQVVVGIVMLVAGWPLAGHVIAHLFAMIFAAVVAQLPVSVMKRREPEARTYAPHVVCTLISVALVWLGISWVGRGLLEASF